MVKVVYHWFLETPVLGPVEIFSDFYFKHIVKRIHLWYLGSMVSVIVRAPIKNDDLFICKTTRPFYIIASSLQFQTRFYARVKWNLKMISVVSM